MENNLILRLISGIILSFISIFCIVMGGIYTNIFMQIALLLMIFEWLSINKTRKSLLFWMGLLYMTIPMIYWAFSGFYYDNRIYLLWVFVIVWSADIFAYFGGRILKGPKLAPKISPNKTWSGAIIGFIMSVAISSLYMSYYLEYNIKILILSSILAISSIYGDLLESKVKRYLNVKDSGCIIPGHGGVCDRLDSFLMVSHVYIIYRMIFL